MRYPQIVVFESDGVLAKTLAPLIVATEKSSPSWLLRESRQGPACLSLLKSGGPSVFVIKIGRHLVREMTLLQDVHATSPDVGIVVVADSDDPVMVGLALELGAGFVVGPSHPRQLIIDVVRQMLHAAIARCSNEAPISSRAESPREPHA